jgi:protein-L-isoaspartate(D-aspartate) O-methyltransferase
MNLEQARENMIKQQVRTWKVLDERILNLMNKYPREEFVPDAWRELAYADINIPLQNGNCMLFPGLEARALQALNVRDGDKVLEIGTGCGYMTALLADLSGDVVSLDSGDHMHASIRQHLQNTRFETGDVNHGWQQLGQFDVVVINGSLQQLPQGLLDLLRADGRLFAVIGDEPVMHATLFRRSADGQIRREVLFETSVPRAPNAEQSGDFAF